MKSNKQKRYDEEFKSSTVKMIVKKEGKKCQESSTFKLIFDCKNLLILKVQLFFELLQYL